MVISTDQAMKRIENLNSLNLTKANAGFPGTADDLIETSLDLNRYIINKPSSTFFMRVDGESMIDAGIFPGDMIVVDRSISPSNQDTIVASLSGSLLIKKLKFIGSKKFLLSENNKFPPIRVDIRDDFEVWGTVTHLIRSLL